MSNDLTAGRVIPRHELANWLIRFALPEVLDATGRAEYAAPLRALAPLTVDRVGSRRPFPGALALIQQVEEPIAREYMDSHNTAIHAGWQPETDRVNEDATDLVFRAVHAARSALLPSQLGTVAHRVLRRGLSILDSTAFTDPARAAEYRAVIDRLEIGLVTHSVYEVQAGGITLLPADVTDDEIARMVRHEYAGAGFTDPEIDVLDYVSQTWNRLGDDLGPVRKPAVEAVSLALSRGWLVETSFGLEPSYAGLQTADLMRTRVGYSALIQPWSERLERAETRYCCTIPEADRPTFLVLEKLDRLAESGWGNQAAPHGDDLVFLLSHPEHCAAMPSFVIPAAVVADCETAGHVTATNGGWALTPAGKQWLGDVYAAGSWTSDWADADQPVGAAN